MNSNYGKNFDFDLGLGSSRPKSLNDQKNNNNSSYSSSSSSYSPYSYSTPKPAWQPNKPSWTHQPSSAQATRPGLSDGSTSMVGDIFGKSWSSTTTPSGSSTAGIGIVDKNPNLFEDLVGSALGQGKTSNKNVPLKNSTPVANKSPFSVGNMADSLPKTNPNPVKNSGNWGSSGNYSSNINANNNRSPDLGGSSMRNIGSSGGGLGASGGMSSKDPFGSLVDFASKPSGNLNSASKSNKVNSSGDNVFGVFQNAPKPQTISSTNTFQSSTKAAKPDSFTSLNSGPGLGMDDLLKPSTQNTTQQSSSDPLDMFFSSTTNSAGGATTNGAGGQQASEIDEWGFEPAFTGDDGGSTTELDGLPPPPAGVNASAAKNKGMDNYKQGQYADAIKWLSWAVILLEKTGDNGTVVEVLSSRASCYKEVGEYKKAVADCTKVLRFIS